ncbi:MAG: 30S ribosomal protein S2 [Verrucomicrobia bacterium]|nr:30S ribosomal protein S2 [Verrucomicrobiota bacterium]MBU4292390.1 30S ribosomal protein S2 [Verrucomicrobiota bacterium]MBU4429078.1 30S ribosomal protein S2 [Verrucomicrobiota bacterium]MBU4496708.1 30S ribosomal protein S2 [Verrucomicrobiota bacterium]MCG2679106.1 30S ribosomal protein S2 [Kiritimatiellia bacterium]
MRIAIGTNKGGTVAAKSELPLDVGISDLLEAGLHFGHQSKRWNPKMKRFIFDKRNGIYIIDLTKTLAQLKEAQQFVYNTIASGKQVVFIGTKKACQEVLKEAAIRCGQHYVISRWLGGTLTNHQNIGSSIRRMRDIEALDQQGQLASMPQKEASRLRHELTRLQRNLGGIANMQNMPGAMIAVDINRETIAVKESNRMNIPVVALVDTNTDPDLVKYPIPGNDDAMRGIKLIVNVLADAIIKASSEYAEAIAQKKEADAVKEKEKAAAESQPRQKRERERRPRRDGTRSREKTLAETASVMSNASSPAKAMERPVPTPAVAETPKPAGSEAKPEG